MLWTKLSKFWFALDLRHIESNIFGRFVMNFYVTLENNRSTNKKFEDFVQNINNPIFLLTLWIHSDPWKCINIKKPQIVFFMRFRLFSKIHQTSVFEEFHIFCISFLQFFFRFRFFIGKYFIDLLIMLRDFPII